MFRKASVADLRSGSVTRAQGHVALCMRRYPRGLSKTKIDEYCGALAPSAALLDAFHSERERQGGNHNAAFLSMHYQQRFELPANAVEDLRRLAELSRNKDVFIVCQCALNERCHRELLIIAAKRWFGAAAELRTFSYPEFEARLGDGVGEILAAG
jgi:uncharacterized protein YeaO (DUF488 family)